MKKAKQEENESVKVIPEEVNNEPVIENVVEPTDEIVSALPVVQSTGAGLLDNPPEQVKPEPKKERTTHSNRPNLLNKMKGNKTN